MWRVTWGVGRGAWGVFVSKMLSHMPPFSPAFVRPWLSSHILPLTYNGDRPLVHSPQQAAAALISLACARGSLVDLLLVVKLLLAVTLCVPQPKPAGMFQPAAGACEAAALPANVNGSGSGDDKAGALAIPQHCEDDSGDDSGGDSGDPAAKDPLRDAHRPRPQRVRVEVRKHQRRLLEKNKKDRGNAAVVLGPGPPSLKQSSGATRGTAKLGKGTMVKGGHGARATPGQVAIMGGVGGGDGLGGGALGGGGHNADDMGDDSCSDARFSVEEEWREASEQPAAAGRRGGVECSASIGALTVAESPTVRDFEASWDCDDAGTPTSRLEGTWPGDGINREGLGSPAEEGVRAHDDTAAVAFGVTLVNKCPGEDVDDSSDHVPRMNALFDLPVASRLRNISCHPVAALSSTSFDAVSVAALGDDMANASSSALAAGSASGAQQHASALRSSLAATAGDAALWSSTVSGVHWQAGGSTVPSAGAPDGSGNNHSLRNDVEERLGVCLPLGNRGRTADMGVWTCGQNCYGELSHGDTVSRNVPSRVEALGGTEVAQIAAGNEHTVVLTMAGEVMSSGYNDNGQCGHGNSGRAGELALVEALSGQRVVQIHAYNGCEHTLVVTADGALHSFGYNYRGQLGHGGTVSSFTPRLVRGLEGRRVTSVACSYYHTVVVCSRGDAFSFGRNDFGQLGLGDGVDRKEPARIAADSLRQGGGVVSVACGQYHTLLITATNSVVGCGKNDYGQLGIDSPDCQRRPTVVPMPWVATVASRDPMGVVDATDPVVEDSVSADGHRVDGAKRWRVVRVACGYYHTLVLCRDDSHALASVPASRPGTAVFSVGRNDYGQLGLGHTSQKVFRLRRVHELGNKGVTNVSSGCYHSLAICEGGSVYVFGRNNHGQLGTGDTAERHVPWLLKSPFGNSQSKYVRGVAAGTRRTPN